MYIGVTGKPLFACLWSLLTHALSARNCNGFYNINYFSLITLVHALSICLAGWLLMHFFLTIRPRWCPVRTGQFRDVSMMLQIPGIEPSISYFQGECDST